jgi:hypothetical protein
MEEEPNSNVSSLRDVRERRRPVLVNRVLNLRSRAMTQCTGRRRAIGQERLPWSFLVCHASPPRL